MTNYHAGDLLQWVILGRVAEVTEASAFVAEERGGRVWTFELAALPVGFREPGALVAIEIARRVTARARRVEDVRASGSC